MSCFKKKFVVKVVDAENSFLYEAKYGGDAGLDLHVAETVVIPPGETMLVDTGVQTRCRSVSKCPWHWVTGKLYKYHSFMMFPRSSIYKTPLMLHNSIGLIDSNYTGNIKMPLRNMSSAEYTVEKGARLCQLVMKDLAPVKCVVVDEFSINTEDKTFRGERGLGSSGK